MFDSLEFDLVLQKFESKNYFPEQAELLKCHDIIDVLNAKSIDDLKDISLEEISAMFLRLDELDEFDMNLHEYSELNRRISTNKNPVFSKRRRLIG